MKEDKPALIAYRQPQAHNSNETEGHRARNWEVYMKRILFTTVAAVFALAAFSANAQQKKSLAFVVNGASDFWKIAEAGVKKAQSELPNTSSR